MEKNRKAEEAVKKWLEENGYDYEVRTYLPSEDAEKRVKMDKDTISIPGAVREILWRNSRNYGVEKSDGE